MRRPGHGVLMLATIVALTLAGCARGGGEGTRGTPPPVAGPSTPKPTSAVSPPGGSLGDLAQSPTPAASPVAQASPPEASPAPASPDAQASPEPKVNAVLTKGITEANEPKETATEFADDTERIYVVLQTPLTGSNAGTQSVGRIVQRLTSDPTQAVTVFENTILPP